MINTELARTFDPELDKNLTNPQNLEAYRHAQSLRPNKQLIMSDLESVGKLIAKTPETLLLLLTNTVAVAAFYAAFRFAINDIATPQETYILGSNPSLTNIAIALAEHPEWRHAYSIGIYWSVLLGAQFLYNFFHLHQGSLQLNQTLNKYSMKYSKHMSESKFYMNHPEF